MTLCPLLEALRAHLGPPGSRNRTHGAAPLPFDAALDDSLAARLRDLPATLRDGAFTWGFVVKANVALWKAGRAPRGGLVLLPTLGGPDVRLDHLARLCESVQALRERAAIPEGCAALARAVGDDHAWPELLEVPKSLTEGISLCVTAAAFHPQHLPRPHLHAPFVPLVYRGNGKGNVTPLPARYWPAAVREAWLGWA